MLGRLTKSILCIAAVTAMASERDPRTEASALIASAGEAAIVQAQRACIAEPGRCVEALKLAGAIGGLKASRDTLTADDRAAEPRRQGG